MIIIDANLILRYLLQDNELLSQKAVDIIENQQTFATIEVIAEVVYVLLSVYNLPRNAISSQIHQLFSQKIVNFQDLDFLLNVIDIFQNTKMDFVDCVLISYHQLYGYEICSFDKKLNNYLARLN